MGKKTWQTEKLIHVSSGDVGLMKVECAAIQTDANSQMQIHFICILPGLAWASSWSGRYPWKQQQGIGFSAYRQCGRQALRKRPDVLAAHRSKIEVSKECWIDIRDTAP